MSAPIVRIRENRRVTAVNPALPRALAWLRSVDPDGDRFELWPVVDYFKAHDAAHGETWNPEAPHDGRARTDLHGPGRVPGLLDHGSAGGGVVDRLSGAHGCAVSSGAGATDGTEGAAADRPGDVPALRKDVHDDPRHDMRLDLSESPAAPAAENPTCKTSSRLIAGATARRVVGELERDAVPIVPEGQRWALVAGLVLGGAIEEMDDE